MAAPFDQCSKRPVAGTVNNSSGQLKLRLGGCHFGNLGSAKMAENELTFIVTQTKLSDRKRTSFISEQALLKLVIGF